MPRQPKPHPRQDTPFPSFERAGSESATNLDRANSASPFRALIKRLSETYGPAGNEERVRDLVRDEIKGHVDQVHVDALGNLIARRRGHGATRNKVMLAAHLDEVGVIVTHIDAQGFCHFGALGDVKPLTLLGARAQFANGVVGIFGRQEQGASRDKIESEKMFIDVSGTATPIKVGDAACLDREFTEAIPYLTGKALDDRIGCAILIQVARQLKKSPHDLYFVFTVQGQVGARGASVAAYSIQPEIAFVVDATHAGDLPGAESSAIALGKGPAIKVKDARLLTNPTARQLLSSAARAAQVPVQLEVVPNLQTDGLAIQSSREGVPTGALSIPTRYIHTSSEMIHYDDVQNAIQILLLLLSKSF